MVRLGIALSASILACVTQAQETPPTTPRSVDRTTTTSPFERPDTHHASCAGTIVDTDGEPIAGALVHLYAYLPYYWAIRHESVTTAEDGSFRFDDITAKGELGLWISAPATQEFWRTYRTLTLVSGQHTPLRPIECENTAAPATPPTTIRGTIRDSKGAPIAGAYLRPDGTKESFDPSATAISNADGSFEIVSRVGLPESLSVFTPGTRLKLVHEEGTKELSAPESRWERDWKIDLAEPLTIAHVRFVQQDLSVRGLDEHETAQFDVSHGSKWVDCGSRACFVRNREGESRGLYVRASTPHRVARVAWVEGAHEFDFSGDEMDSIVVVGPDGPIADAILDVTGADAGGTTRTLGSFRTDAEGRRRVLAEPGATYEVWAYADRHEPARATWTVGKGAKLTLRSTQSVKIVTSQDDADCSLFVRPAGLFSPARVIYPRGSGTTELQLAPGTYEITKYGPDEIRAAERVVFPTDSETLEIDADQRPVVTVRLPRVDLEGEFWVYASRRAVGGMVSRWRAHSGGRRVMTRELDPEFEEKDGVHELRFPTSGRYTILVGHEKLEHRLFRDVDLRFGETLEIELPALDSSLSATSANYPELWAIGAQHGIAGPRLLLLPDRANGTEWGCMHALPEKAEFLIERLPAGRFHLSHHMYETGFYSSTDGWFGSQYVELKSGESTDVGTLDKRARRKLSIRIENEDGEPVRGRVSVRDRMFESWSKVVERGTTLRNAMDPIPSPPRTDLDGEGAGTLENITDGHVEFVLMTPDGSTTHFIREVLPDEPLVVTLRTP